MFQQVTIVGNVGQEPELRYTKSGVAVCTLSVAVNKRFTDSEGNKRDETTWFRVTSWRAQAEVVAKYVHKGSKIMAIGEVRASAYMDKNNQPAASLELTANEVKFLDSRQDNDAPEEDEPQAEADPF